MSEANETTDGLERELVGVNEDIDRLLDERIPVEGFGILAFDVDEKDNTQILLLPVPEDIEAPRRVVGDYGLRSGQAQTTTLQLHFFVDNGLSASAWAAARERGEALGLTNPSSETVRPIGEGREKIDRG